MLHPFIALPPRLAAAENTAALPFLNLNLWTGSKLPFYLATPSPHPPVRPGEYSPNPSHCPFVQARYPNGSNSPNPGHEVEISNCPRSGALKTSSPRPLRSRLAHPVSSNLATLCHPDRSATAFSSVRSLHAVARREGSRLNLNNLQLLRTRPQPVTRAL